MAVEVWNMTVVRSRERDYDDGVGLAGDGRTDVINCLCVLADSLFVGNWAFAVVTGGGADGRVSFLAGGEGPKGCPMVISLLIEDGEREEGYHGVQTEMAELLSQRG